MSHALCGMTGCCAAQDWGLCPALLEPSRYDPCVALPAVRFLITPLGKELLALPEAEGHERALKLDREFRRNRPKRAQDKATAAAPVDPEEAELVEEEEVLLAAEEQGTAPERWQFVLLPRLYRLSPTGFEEFVPRSAPAVWPRMERVGGTGDEGIDGIGTAPLARFCRRASRSR